MQQGIPEMKFYKAHIKRIIDRDSNKYYIQNQSIIGSNLEYKTIKKI